MFIVNSQNTFIDYPSAEDWAVIYFFSGCCNNCANCQNKLLQQVEQTKFEYKINSAEELYNIIKKDVVRYCTNKIVFSGGDPLFESNRSIIKEFLEKYGDQFDICVYTGYSIDNVKKFDIKNFKFIKCGKFEETNKQESYKSDNKMVLASTNQNFYDSNYNQLSKTGVLNF